MDTNVHPNRSSPSGLRTSCLGSFLGFSLVLALLLCFVRKPTCLSRTDAFFLIILNSATLNTFLLAPSSAGRGGRTISGKQRIGFGAAAGAQLAALQQHHTSTLWDSNPFKQQSTHQRQRDLRRLSLQLSREGQKPLQKQHTAYSIQRNPRTFEFAAGMGMDGKHGNSACTHQHLASQRKTASTALSTLHFELLPYT